MCWGREAHGTLDHATASWSVVVLHRFERVESASRRRAEAALWCAAKAEGLAHSRTYRIIGLSRQSERKTLNVERLMFCTGNPVAANVNWRIRIRAFTSAATTRWFGEASAMGTSRIPKLMLVL